MMPRGGSPSGWFGGPLWVSGFRPFFLLGSAYGIVALGLALPSFAVGNDFVPPLGGSGRLWHGHEMVFGFAAAIVSGLLLTALPSWAGVPEIAGGRLAFLVCVWLGGRIAVGFARLLAPALVAIADVAALVTLVVMLAPGLLAARDKRYLVVLPVLLAMAAANLAFHARLATDPAGALRALDAGVAALAILFSLTGGFLTPVFTRNALVEIGAAARIREHRYLEAAAHASVIAFALACAVPLPAPVEGCIAAAACVAHAARLAGWRGLAARGNAMVLAMHLGYAWLVVAFALAAVSALGLGIAPRAWIHAFTIGAVGTMMLALMPRVALRHTGRPLVLSPVMLATYPVMSIAALLRVALVPSEWSGLAVDATALLWASCFVAYLVLYGRMLLHASLPRPASEG